MSDENYKITEETVDSMSASPEGRSGTILGPQGNYVYPTVHWGCSRMYGDDHKGIDIRDRASDHGVYAFAAGTVSFVQSANNPDPGKDMDTMGNCIAINHPNPITTNSANYVRTIYMHLRDVPTVTPGQKVARGQFIGVIGSTGESTGNHLHFTMAVGNDTALSPDTKKWTSISSLPLVDPVLFLPKYYEEKS